LQRTPLRVEQDRAFFSASFCYNVIAINRGGAAKAQPVGRVSFLSYLDLVRSLLSFWQKKALQL
jgi:hypothetical protein